MVIPIATRRLLIVTASFELLLMLGRDQMSFLLGVPMLYTFPPPDYLLTPVYAATQAVHGINLLTILRLIFSELVSAARSVLRPRVVPWLSHLSIRIQRRHWGQSRD